jgi:hypothetical protein
MSPNTIVNGMHLHQPPLTVVALVVLAILATATAAGGALVGSTLIIGTMALLALMTRRGLLLAYQTGVALRYCQDGHPTLVVSLESYAEVLEQTGQAFEAHPYRHRAEQIRAHHATRPGA